MKIRFRNFAIAVIAAFSCIVPSGLGAEEIRVGIIGLDTSHVIAFTKAMNDPKAEGDLAICKVVAAYPKGSPSIESSFSRVPKYTKELVAMGIEIVPSIAALLEKVDAVLLETNDGHPHLEQLLPVLAAGKRVFIDKPVAASLSDAITIFDASKKSGVPVFSSSALRFAEQNQAVRDGSIGKVSHVEAGSPATIEPTHPDLFWYGIHGVESLFTILGPGCESVKRSLSADGKVRVEGKWSDGRTGVFEERKGYGGLARGAKGEAEIGTYDGYDGLITAIAKFFRSGEVPVSPEETLEVYAFMEAADESKRQSGAEITLASVMQKAAAKTKADPAP